MNGIIYCLAWSIGEYEWILFTLVTQFEQYEMAPEVVWDHGFDCIKKLHDLESLEIR